MKLYGTRVIDNRDSEQVYDYMEARIEALKHRIQELETEKEALSANTVAHTSPHVKPRRRAFTVPRLSRTVSAPVVKSAETQTGRDF
jgi:cell division protein FtsB